MVVRSPAAQTSKTYANDSAVRALTEALERRGDKGVVEPLAGHPGNYTIRYAIAAHELMSIIIPTRDHAADLERVETSIFEKSTYANFEVIILDNGSRDVEALKLMAKWENDERRRVKVVRYDVPFNFSELTIMPSYTVPAAICCF